MDIKAEDYERLGAFFLGREYDLAKKELEDDLVLYDSKDLVTHGVVLGMTGSGKTGLCIAMLEEAAMDGVPALVIDPKGDIANLLLTFPELRGEDFRPWINEDDAKKKGVSPEEHADNQAAMWKKGIGEWGQSGDRIAQFREKVDITVYTPGSSAGVPVSILSSLEAPPFEVIDDAELLAERIESTVSSLLSLLGIDADPIQDPEHILLSNIFSHRWQAEESVTLESLIGDIQEPPFEKVGVMEVESIYPKKKRTALAMKMNNLLASPGFGVWLKGEPLDVQRMLYTPEGKPRISICSIAHLSDTERMFFVSLLLNQTLGWMRAQSGTTSLRALLYMDEIYGYLPPTANPPSKKPMLTMLKQARAFGLGVLLATQNPVDLDYKALSNMGTWFLGRLQTERDKMRVLDGLEGAAASQDSGFDRRAMEETLAGLGSRVFLLNNVHEDAPVTFHVRWVMSYLRGPLTRRQIKTLMKDKAAAEEKREEEAAPAEKAPADVAAPLAEEKKAAPPARPSLPKGVREYFLASPAVTPDQEIVYLPGVLGCAEIRFAKSSAKDKLDISGKRRLACYQKLDSGGPAWDAARELPLHAKPLEAQPHARAQFGGLGNGSLDPKALKDLEDEFVDWIYHSWRLKIFRSPTFKEHSGLEESEGDFRARMALKAHEKRDELKEELREKYEKELKKIQERVESAMRTLDREKSESTSAKMRSAMSIGGTVLGVLMGRKSVSLTNMRRGMSAASSLGSASRQKGDVERAEEKVEDLQEKFEALEDELKIKLRELEEDFDPMTEELEIVEIKPYKKDIKVDKAGMVWLPHLRPNEFELKPAWQA